MANSWPKVIFMILINMPRLSFAKSGGPPLDQIRVSTFKQNLVAIQSLQSKEVGLSQAHSHDLSSSLLHVYGPLSCRLKYQESGT